MRRFVSFTITFLGVACLQAAFAQGFTGTFVSPEASLSVTLQQGPDGSLSGVVTGPNGQFALQGQSSGPAAYGVVATQQGQLGFQAALSTDGGTLTMELYQTGPNGQPTPAGPALTLLRSGGGALPGGGFAGQAPGQAPGPATGGVPGGMPPQAPGAMPAGVPGQVPGGFPGQAQGGLPGQPAGGFPGQAPGGFPAPPAAPPVGGDWNGTFVGDAGAVVGTITANDGGSITLGVIGGSTVTVVLTPDTEIITLTGNTADSLEVGATAVATGSAVEQGRMTAQTVVSASLPSFGGSGR